MGGLTYARAELSTVRGAISAGWRRSNGAFELDVAVPPNTRATVSVPKLGEADPMISEGGVTVWNRGEPIGSRAGINGSHQTDEAVVFDVGSGDYSFMKGREE